MEKKFWLSDLLTFPIITKNGNKSDKCDAGCRICFHFVGFPRSDPKTEKKFLDWSGIPGLSLGNDYLRDPIRTGNWRTHPATFNRNAAGLNSTGALPANSPSS